MKQSSTVIERIARAIALAGKHATLADLDKIWPAHVVEAEAAARIVAGINRTWVVGITKHQQELTAQHELREQGYGVYLPKHYTRHQEGRLIEARAELRYSGYIMIALDLELQEHGPISNTKGMDGSDGPALVLDGPTRPAILRAGVIEDLRKIEDDELARALARKPSPRDDILPGDKVKFIGDLKHPAYGLEGTYMGSKRRGCATIFAGWKDWEVAQGDLRKVEDKKAA